jgi:methylglutaconyl-CoA hydratase
MRRILAWRIPRVYRSYSSAVESTIKVKHHPAPHSGNIRILLLDRPEARNALSRKLVADLKHHVDEIQAEGGTGSTRALIIASSTDKAFCAGADLRERKGMTQEECEPPISSRPPLTTHRTREFLTGVRNTFTNLSNLPIPTVSAIASVALGGGLELGLCTTFRVFGSTAIVGQPETKLAIIPGAGGTYRLPALIGVNRARDLILTGRRVSGAEAYFLGLCNRLVEVTTEEAAEEGKARQKVLDASIQLANDICEGGPIALTQALRAVNGWQRGEASENEAYEVILKTEDRLEALKAFAEKRKPAFKGR